METASFGEKIRIDDGYQLTEGSDEEEEEEDAKDVQMRRRFVRSAREESSRDENGAQGKEMVVAFV